jgi:hypothetical protein
MMHEAVRQFLAAAGRKGGSARTAAQIATAKQNLKLGPKRRQELANLRKRTRPAT